MFYVEHLHSLLLYTITIQNLRTPRYNSLYEKSNIECQYKMK